MQPPIDSELAPIRERFLKLLISRNDEILSQLDVALGVPAQAGKPLGAVESILHKIAGSAGTLGFDELGNQARNVEYEIRATRATDVTDFDAIYQNIIAYLEYAMTLTENDA